MSAGVRPQVVAHRGASGEHPEHTLTAYLQAIADGADALECDVRLTRDHQLICVHDRRVDRTSDGRGPVSALELADLHQLDFGSWKEESRWDVASADQLVSDRFEAPDSDRSRVLTLDRLLGAVLAHPRRVELAVETKHPTRYAGLVERELVALLERHRALDRVRVMSFAASGLRRVHFLAPAVPTVLLMHPVPRRLRDGRLPPRVPVAGPSLAYLRADPGYVARVHAQGGEVHVWTVDDPEDVALVLELGVDAVITDHPARVRRMVDGGP